SPRRGVAILFLKGLEQGGGGSADFVVFQGSGIERQGTAQHLLRKGALLFHGEMFEGVQQCFGISAHEHIIPAHPRAKKKSFRRLQVTLSPFAFPLRTALSAAKGPRVKLRYLGIPLTQVLLYVVVLVAPSPPVLAIPDHPIDDRKPLGSKTILCRARQAAVPPTTLSRNSAQIAAPTALRRTLYVGQPESRGYPDSAKLGARVGGDHEKARPGGICLAINRREDQGTW